MERKLSLALCGLLLATALAGCQSLAANNVFSRSYGLPPQYEDDAGGIAR